MTRWALGVAWAWVTLGSPIPAAAQAGPDRWNDARVRALVALAIARRSRQLADTGLTDYRAMARGYLTFLAQVGPGFPDPPKIVRADELAVEVYWRAPNLSKQRIVGQRDTLLLPADIGYYTDRYGIIQNNFPDSIRLGDGNDLRGVPHPLAPAGPSDYDYAIADSLAIRFPDRAVDVIAVRVRPRDPAAPRVVGTLYLERETGALVRMTLTFTRAAILDRRIETLAVTLDNSLVDGRFWLPHHQELEVARTGTWLDYPVRGIIRGRWQICCYTINSGLAPALFAGPEIVAEPPRVLAGYPWVGRVLDSLPADVAVASVADVERVEATARAIVQTAALARARGAAFSARGISDLARVDRVEGLALGAGATRFLGPAWSVSALGRYGLDDRQGKGEATLRWQSFGALSARAIAYRSYRDAGDVAETSTLVNSLAAQEFGADHTDPYDARGVGLGVDLAAPHGLRWSFLAARETQRRLLVHADPATGRFGPTIAALPLQATRASLALERGAAPGPAGLVWRARVELRGELYTAADTVLVGGAASVGRAFAELEAERTVGEDRLVTRITLGGATSNGPLPAQEYVYEGGAVTGPGYPYHAFAARLAGSVRAEWQFPVSAPSVSLGRYGRSPGRATVAPFVVVDYVGRSALPGAPVAGVYPALGLGGLGLFDLVRVDVARGLRQPGRWTVWVDLTRDLWGVL